MIKIKYKDWYEIDLDDTHHLRKKDTKDWLQKDFTLFTKFKTDWDSIVKTKDENQYCNVVGKPGLHAGVSIARNEIYKFDFWTKSESEEPTYNSVGVTEGVIDNSNFIDVIVGHNLDDKKLYIISYDSHEDKILSNEVSYDSDIIDYSWCPTYVGCGYHDEEAGYPHNSWWSGDIERFKVLDLFIPKSDIEKVLNPTDYDSLQETFNENPYFDFDGKKQVVDSVYDISENNNHLRRQRQGKLTYYNSTQYINQSKTSIL